MCHASEKVCSPKCGFHCILFIDMIKIYRRKEKEVTDTARWERLDCLSNAEGAVNHTASEPHLFGHYHSGSWHINFSHYLDQHCSGNEDLGFHNDRLFCFYK